jgi:hypothetical protein
MAQIGETHVLSGYFAKSIIAMTVLHIYNRFAKPTISGGKYPIFFEGSHIGDQKQTTADTTINLVESDGC